MKHIKLTTLIFGLLLFGCNQANTKTTSVKEEKVATSADDKEQIQNLIRQVLNWADSKNSIDLLPVLTDNKNSVYIGFDLDKHKQNLDKLKQTNFFATEFIENYNQIILTLDKGLKNGNYDQWLVGDLPTFIFSNDHSPWCNCQDNDDWNKVEVRVIKLTDNEGELEWTWGNLSADAHSSWKEFAYKFRVVKENDKWKIAYLTGFDFKESTRKDGQL
ncbi:MAG: hypothetical protein LC109_08550 [Bacteroidia bacterium]|nr:hypothetical protein [Bacteroidia bacterium]